MSRLKRNRRVGVVVGGCDFRSMEVEKAGARPNNPLQLTGPALRLSGI
jgi:hypothetical protein